MPTTSAELAAAIDFARRAFHTWRDQGRLTDKQLSEIDKHYDAWLDRLVDGHDYSRFLPERAKFGQRSREQIDAMQGWGFLMQETRRHTAQGRATSGTMEACYRDAKQSYDALLEGGVAEAPAEPVFGQPPNAPPTPPAPRRSFVELLLDPRGLHVMMASGASLLVLGLVAWMWSVGVFENRLVMASCLGGANLALLGAGVGAARFTRYQTAGRGAAMLACVVMPLNLWFYDAQGIVDLSEGGRLWAPALVCCVLYAVVARALRDSLFVYASVAGVALTGLLFLADSQVAHFWEVLSPSTLLVTLGVLCVAAERAFPDGKGPFTRSDFGRACFRAGHASLGAGLAVLLGGRVAGLLYEPLVARWAELEVPDVSVLGSAKLHALLLVATGGAVYLYSQYVHGPARRFGSAAVLSLLWCQLILLDLLHVEWHAALVAAVLAANAFVASVVARVAERHEPAASGAFANTARWLSAVLSVVVVVLCGFLAAGAVFEPLASVLTYEFNTPYLFATALTAAACLTAKRPGARSTASQFHVSCAAMSLLLLGAAGLSLLGVQAVATASALLMVLPAALLATGWRAEQGKTLNPWMQGAEQTTVVLVFSAIAAMLGLAPAGSPLATALLFAEAAALFGVSASRDQRRTSVVLSVACAGGAAWQLLAYFGLTQEAPALAGTAVGLAALVAHRWMSGREGERVSLRQGALAAGVATVVLSATAAVLMAGEGLLLGTLGWSMGGTLVVQAAASVAAGWLVGGGANRRGLQVLAACQLMVAFLVVQSLSPLDFGQKLEVFATLAGVVMLGVGHAGWAREGTNKDGHVTASLTLGSLLAALPMLGTLVNLRWTGDSALWGWVMLHEVGVLLVGLSLVGAGVLCRVRSTTLVGSTTLGVYVASLVTLLRLPDALQSTAVYMMAGGGAFFAAALVLSVYRDRLLAMPEQARQGKRVFRVLKWR